MGVGKRMRTWYRRYTTKEGSEEQLVVIWVFLAIEAHHDNRSIASSMCTSAIPKWRKKFSLDTLRYIVALLPLAAAMVTDGPTDAPPDPPPTPRDTGGPAKGEGADGGKAGGEETAGQQRGAKEGAAAKITSEFLTSSA
jgi:hypothetical protein